MGEDIGWLMTPFLHGFYYGYMATKDPKWMDHAGGLDRLVGSSAAVKEPDGYVGWPKRGAAGTAVDKLDDFNADSLLGEAMVLRPIVLMAGEISRTPALKAKYGAKAESYIKLAEQVYEKWDKRGAWRETKDGGMISRRAALRHRRGKTGKWTAGYETRNDPGNGFSHPDNKANHVACWLLAMFDVTGKPVYKERAEKWFRLMKSRHEAQAPTAHSRSGTTGSRPGPGTTSPTARPSTGWASTPTAATTRSTPTGIVDAYEHGLVFTGGHRPPDRHGQREKQYW